MRRRAPVHTDIVLVGGGHAHVHVLKAFGMRAEPGVEITLITRDLNTPYSGMLPGVIAGLYKPEEAHIDLLKLAAATDTRLIHAEAIGLDRAQKRILLAGRPPIAYDIASIDVGITPAIDAIAGASEHAIAVKPIGSFLGKFDRLVEQCRRPDGPRRIVVIGGGAGGVELILSVRSRLLAEMGTARGRGLSLTLVSDSSILESHNPRVSDAFRRVLAEKGITLHEHCKVTEIDSCSIQCASGISIESDAVLMATDAAPPDWLRNTGLALDANGFLAVGPTLQILNDPDVFAAGDCAGLVETPRPKAGVFAVRAGPRLADNLRRRARGEPLRLWRPQHHHLALISTGERYAIASRGWFKAEGAWLWTLKDWIDRRWMRTYQDVEKLTKRMSAARSSVRSDDTSSDEMRCGGCAAKVGPGPLSRALSRLPPPLSDDSVTVGLDTPDDAAVVLPPRGRQLVQTVDLFRAFIDDSFAFGEIAANHALNDIFAMGGLPHHALAIAVVPPATASKVEEMLFQLLSGARSCLDREGVVLVGGHSSEGSELALGFSVTGLVGNHVLKKSGLRAGDMLILTKPLGTGILFAGAMRARAAADSVEAALREMRRSNRKAAELLVAHTATAMTDVSGFGLIGHLGEMLSASGAQAELRLASVPHYQGVPQLARQGITSTLLPQNLALGRLLQSELDAPTRALLFDPQTSGGLLAGVPGERAEACLSDLHSAGYAYAAIIGQVSNVGLPAAQAAITLSGRSETIAHT